MKLLDFHRNVNEQTGELGNYAETDFKALKIKVYDSGRIEIRGSLHKFWNDGINNNDDFGIIEIRLAVKKLEKELGIDSKLMRIHNIEIGLNIRHNFDTKTVLYSLIAYGNKPFNDKRTNTPGIYRTIERNQFMFKGYDKGFGLDFPLLRFELHTNKMEYISKQPIFLSDLGTVSFLNNAFQRFMSSVDNLIFTERLDKKKLSFRELELYHKCSNPIEWRDMTAKERCINKKAFESLIDEHGTYRYKITLKEFIQDKWSTLLRHLDFMDQEDISFKECSDHLITISDHSVSESPKPPLFHHQLTI